MGLLSIVPGYGDRAGTNAVHLVKVLLSPGQSRLPACADL